MHLRADELVQQQLELGQTVTVVGVPVLDASRRVVTLEARYNSLMLACQFSYSGDLTRKLLEDVDESSLNSLAIESL